MIMKKTTEKIYYITEEIMKEEKKCYKEQPEKFFFRRIEIKLLNENTIKKDNLNMTRKIIINSL